MSLFVPLLHGLDLLVTTLFVGGVVFSAWIHSAGGDFADQVSPRWGRAKTPILFFLLILTVAWFFTVAHEMTDTFALDDLKTVALSSSFGRLWIAKGGLLMLLLIASLWDRLRRVHLLVLLLPLFSSLNGHAVAQKEHTDIYVALDYFHFLGVSIWMGGLVALVFWLRSRVRQEWVGFKSETTQVLMKRFSHFAIGSTAVIAASGVSLAYLYGVRLGGLFGTPYSKLVMTKTLLFAMTLGIASINQFVHLRHWTPEKEPSFARGVYRESLLELLLIVAVLLVAGFLTRTDAP